MDGERVGIEPREGYAGSLAQWLRVPRHEQRLGQGHVALRARLAGGTI